MDKYCRTYANGKYSLYIDGEMVGEKSISKNTPLDSASYNIGIGDDPQYNGRRFNGLIDNVMVLKKRLLNKKFKKTTKFLKKI